jgi:hypothetical protein
LKNNPTIMPENTLAITAKMSTLKSSPIGVL